MENRVFRAAGEILPLGGVDYRLEGVEGFGGSSVVYRAAYEDGLNRGSFHQVLIRELFPYDRTGAIYRNDRGEICCRQEGRERMDACRRGLIRGNQANLELLEQLPEQTAGNLNSFEAYGTYYTVLTVHGGATLERLLEKEQGYFDLRQAACICLQILEALEAFHRRGLLHLDISPDNILVLKERALLIDYGSVLYLDDAWKRGLTLSVKEGYTAPEVRLREIGQIGPASDLFGVCAVFFRMIAGRRLTVEDLTGAGPGRGLAEGAPGMETAPETARWKGKQIAAKGLHVLARKRYQSVGELKEEFEELIRRIDGLGVSQGAVWECGRRRLRQMAGEETFLERRLRRLDGKDAVEQPDTKDAVERLDTASCLVRLKAGEHFLISGPGGMGKSRFVTELAMMGTKKYSPKEPAPVYLSLADYPGWGHPYDYIRASLLSGLSPERPEETGGERELRTAAAKTSPWDAAAAALEEIFDREPEQGGGILLLLDGLNEAGNRTEGLIREIEELGRRPGVRILVTDRTDSVKEYGLRDFSSWELLPLEREQVTRRLKEEQIILEDGEEREGMVQLLANPMMLSLYCRTARMDREARGGQDGREEGNRRPDQDNGEQPREMDGGRLPKTMDEMAGRYLEQVYLRQMRADSGSRGAQLAHGYVLCHVLPAAALEMKRRGRSVLTFQELFDLAGASFRQVRTREFALAFPEYAGKSRLMMETIGNEGEWFDYAVSEQLTERLGLLIKSRQGNYRLIHDNFMGYLAGRGEENRRKLSRVRRADLKKKGRGAAIALCFLAAAGAAAVRLSGAGGFSGEEKRVMKNAAQRLLINMQLLDLQIAGQEQILEEASTEEVLGGEESGCRFLSEMIRRKREEQAHYQLMAGDGKQWLEELERLETEIPLDVLGELYGMPAEMDAMTEEAMDHLERSLCDPESPYRTREQREPIVEAYGGYLDACADVCYLKLGQAVSEMDEESADLVLDGVAEMAVFKDVMLNYPLEPEKEERERLLRAAENRLEDAGGIMRQQNFPMESQGWES